MEQSESTAAKRSRTGTRRRWLRFSIRTMLVVVTLLCVALSLWVVPAERRRRAVAALEALGGGVSFVDSQTTNESFSTTLLRRWLPQAYVDEVAYVRLNDSQISDAGLAHLHGLMSLRSLWLDNTQVTDAGLVHLQRLMGLQELSLDNTQITDSGLANLEGLTGLRVLWLGNTQITDAGLAHLEGLTSLKSLSLNETEVPDAGLAHLKGLTGLQQLWLINTQVTDAGLAQLRKALPQCEIYGP